MNAICAFVFGCLTVVFLALWLIARNDLKHERARANNLETAQRICLWSYRPDIDNFLTSCGWRLPAALVIGAEYCEHCGGKIEHETDRGSN